MEQIIPTVGSTGVFKGSVPFLLSPNVIYTCESVRSMDDLYKDGINVKTAIYDPAFTGDPSFDFERERARKPKIVRLRSSDGFYIYIPTTFLVGVPDVTRVPYHQVVLSVDLGPLPDNMDLGLILNEFSVFASKFIGVNATVRKHVLSLSENPTDAEHQQLENARAAALATYSTHAQQVAKLQSQLDAANLKIKQLSQTVNKRTT